MTSFLKHYSYIQQRSQVENDIQLPYMSNQHKQTVKYVNIRLNLPTVKLRNQNCMFVV